jgi:hypothetical protein
MTIRIAYRRGKHWGTRTAEYKSEEPRVFNTAMENIIALVLQNTKTARPQVLPTAMENISELLLQNTKSAGPRVLPIAMENIGALVLQNSCEVRTEFINVI